MPEGANNTKFLFSPLGGSGGYQLPAGEKTNRRTNVQQDIYIEELKRVNEEMRQARRAALNLIEDAVLSKEALRESEEKYRTLFNSIDDAFCIIEMIFDETGQPVDFKYIETNPAFVKHVGQPMLGGRVREFIPDFEPFWLNQYGHTAKTGEPVQLENSVHGLSDQWFRASAFRLGGESSNQVAVIFRNITERKRQEEKQQYLLELSDALRTCSNPDSVLQKALKTVGEYIDVDRVSYNEIDAAVTEYTVRANYLRKGFPSNVGRYSIDPLKETAKNLQEGKIFIVNDANDERFSEAEKAVYASMNVGASVTVPLVKNGQWVCNLVAHNSKPRKWKEHEIAILEETAERTWAAVERAKTQEALRQSEERSRLLITAITDSVYKMSANWKQMYNLEGKTFLSDTGNTNSSWLENYIPAGERNRVTEAIEEAIANKAVFELEHQVIDAAGAIGWVYSRAVPRLNEQGEIVEWIGAGSNITHRKQAEEALRENNLRKEFLLKLNDTIRELSDPEQIQYEAARLVGEQLEADRVHFAELSEDEQLVIRKDYIRGNAPSIAGVTRAKVIAAALKLERDEPVVITDVDTFPLLSNEEKATLAAAKIRSQLSVALSKKGKKVASFAIDQMVPRQWKPLEISILQEAAERTLAAVERAKAEEALRISEFRFRRLSESGIVAIEFFDVDGGIFEANDAFLQMLGITRNELNSGKVRWDTYTPEEWMPQTLAAVEEFKKTGYIAPYEKQYYHNNGDLRWGIFSAATLGDEKTGVSLIIDITRRKKAEDALRESENRLSTLANAVPQVIWTNDAEGKADYFNQRWYEYSGLRYDQSVGLGWQAIVHPDDSLASTEKWKQALAAGELFDTEYRLRRHDGVYRWFIGRNIPLRDVAGNITSWFGSATDVEDLKKTQEELSKSEERLKVTMETATDYAIITLDIERRIERWSSGAAQILGYTEAEALGQPSDLVFTETDKQAGVPQKEMETARDFGRAVNERWHLRKDGSLFFASGVMRPIRNGILSGYVKILRDVTEQREAEETLRMTEERYRIALQSAEMGAWDWNIADNEVSWNDQHFHLLGLEPSPQKIDSSFFLRFVHKADRKRVAEELRGAVDDTGIYHAEFRIYRADNNELRWMSGYGKVVEKKENKSMRMVGVMYDTTKRRVFTEELSGLVAERTKELERSNADLQQFAHIASHDLKEPVRKIKTFNNRIIDDFGSTLPAKVKTYLHKIGSASDRMILMIEGILNYSKFGRAAAAIELVNLTEVIRQIESDLEVLIEKKDAQIEKSNLPPITGDSVLLYQLFYNLVLNALKFSKTDENPVIKIACENVEQNKRKFYKITVSDNGIGFEQEYAETIFSTFTRLHSANEYEGTGLGLALCKKIVERHGGSISATSELDKGAIFIILLPDE